MANQAENKKMQKRIKLLDEAYKLFMEKGVNMTAIDDVVKKAGVAKGTFYLYFRDKYDLFDQIIAYKSANIIKDALDKLAEKKKNENLELADQILFFTDTLIGFLIENKAIVPLINKNLSSGYTLLISDESSELHQSFEEFVSLLMEKGYSRKSTEIHLFTLTNMIGSVCCEAILTGKPYSIEDVMSEVHFMIEKIFR